MTVLVGILVVLHMIGWAIVLGGALTNMRPPRIARGMTHGALTALIAGALAVGASEMAGGELDNVKIGVKLAVALVVTALVFYGARREEKVTTGLLGAIAGLTVVNIAIAVLWR